VKLLGSGQYAVEQPSIGSDGHFGLAVRDYTHSTAPNRRFPDLITQRLLKAALAGVEPPIRLKSWPPLAATAQSRKTTRTRSSDRCASPPRLSYSLPEWVSDLMRL
jgi:exoribonuclease-2